MHRIVTTFEDIDKEKREVLVAHEKLKWDAFTELYNKQSFEAEIFRLLAKNNGGTDILILFVWITLKMLTTLMAIGRGTGLFGKAQAFLKIHFAVAI